MIELLIQWLAILLQSVASGFTASKLITMAYCTRVRDHA